MGHGTSRVSGGTAAKKTPEPEKSGASTPQNFSVAKLEVKDGKLTVGKANSAAKPQVYEKLNVEVTKFSFTLQFPFTLTAGLPGGGNANVSGKAGPINPQDAALAGRGARVAYMPGGGDSLPFIDSGLLTVHVERNDSVVRSILHTAADVPTTLSLASVVDTANRLFSFLKWYLGGP